LYNILIEIELFRKSVVLTKIWLNETCIKVRISKYLSDNFPIQNGAKYLDVTSQLLINFLSDYVINERSGIRSIHKIKLQTTDAGPC
jgi:hypothetical protein